MKNNSLVLSYTYEVDSNKVWKAITQLEEMRKWYFNIDDFNPVVGFEFQFYGTGAGSHFLHLCKVLSVNPLNEISYSWCYANYIGESILTWTLESLSENKTKITLTHRGLETFPSENDDFNVKRFHAGWTYFLEKALPNYLYK